MKKIVVLALINMSIPFNYDRIESTKRAPLPIEQDKIYKYICEESIDTSIEAGIYDLVDEHKFDRSINGKIKLLSYEKIYLNSVREYTLGIKLDKDSVRMLSNYTLPVSIHIKTFPVKGGAPISDSFSRPVSYGFNSEVVINSSILKSIKLIDNGVLLGMKLSVDSYITEFDFSFGTASSVIEKVQLSPQGVASFPGFYPGSHAPCKIPTEIVGEEVNIEVPYNPSNLGIVSDLVGATKAYDEGDEVYLTPKIISDDFTRNRNILDTFFKVKLQVEDSLGNTSFLTYNIKSVDRISPKIDVKSSNSAISYKMLDQEENILNLFTITDNHQVKESSIKSFDYNKAKKIMGFYDVTIQAEDWSGNITESTNSIEVVDDVPPTIEGPEEINISNSKRLNEDGLLAYFNAVDEIDGTVPLKIIKNNYASNYKKLGTYDLVVEAKDKSQNIQQMSTKVVVRDEEGPIFMVYSGIIKLHVGEIIEVKQILNSLISSGKIPDRNYLSSTVVEGGDITEKLQLGLHKFKLLLTDDLGESHFVDLRIEVIEKINETNSKLSFWKRIQKFFKDIYSTLKKFFESFF